MRTPPCSWPPLAGAHVGRAAVVISPHSFLPPRTRTILFTLSLQAFTLLSFPFPPSSTLTKTYLLIFFEKRNSCSRLFSQQQSKLLPIFGNKNPKKKKQTTASTISSAQKQSLPRRFHSPTIVGRERRRTEKDSL